MEVGIGYKCPQGHFKVQMLVGKPKCPICGADLVADNAAPDAALNRYCRKCNSFIGLNLYDSGKCPDCGTPFE